MAFVRPLAALLLLGSTSTDIVHGDDGAMTLTAQLTYQNEGLLEGGAIRQAELTYTIELAPNSDGLPLLSDVQIAQDSESTVDTFEDAYAKNRVLSLVHYWLTLIEDPMRDPEPVREILADDVALNFSSGTITDFEGFSAWLADPGSAVAASTHVIEDFAVTETAPGTYAATMVFDWTGLLPDGTPLVAKTKHSWTVVNTVTDRGCRGPRSVSTPDGLDGVSASRSNNRIATPCFFASDA